MAWQFDRSDLGRGVIQVFRRQDSAYESARFHLHELAPEARYKITNLDDQVERLATGKGLMDDGFPVATTKQPDALTFTYEHVQ